MLNTAPAGAVIEMRARRPCLPTKRTSNLNPATYTRQLSPSAYQSSDRQASGEMMVAFLFFAESLCTITSPLRTSKTNCAYNGGCSRVRLPRTSAGKYLREVGDVPQSGGRWAGGRQPWNERDTGQRGVPGAATHRRDGLNCFLRPQARADVRPQGIRNYRCGT